MLTDMTLSEVQLNIDLLSMRESLLVYFSSQDFVQRWQFWISTRDYLQLPVELEHSLFTIINGAFIVSSHDLFIIKQVIKTSLSSQLRILYFVYTNIYTFDLPFVPLLNTTVSTRLMDNVLYACGYSGESVLDGFPCVYDKACDVYEKQFSAIIKLQRQWRICISNPSFVMCKNRLIHEFNDLQI